MPSQELHSGSYGCQYDAYQRCTRAWFDASIVAPRSPKHGIDPCLHAAGRVLSTRPAGVARYIATRPFETLMTL